MGLLLFRTNLLFITVYGLSLVPLFFFTRFSWLYAAALLLLFLAGERGFSNVRREAENRISFAVSPLLHRGLSIILTVLSLVLALVYYVETGDRPVTDPSALLENPSSARLVQVIGPHILKETLPGYKPGITVDEYLSARIQEEVGVDVAKIKPEEQRVLLDEARKKLSREAGVPVEPNDRIDDVFSRIVLGRAKGFIEPYAKFLPIA